MTEDLIDQPSGVIIGPVSRHRFDFAGFELAVLIFITVDGLGLFCPFAIGPHFVCKDNLVVIRQIFRRLIDKIVRERIQTVQIVIGVIGNHTIRQDGLIQVSGVASTSSLRSTTGRMIHSSGVRQSWAIATSPLHCSLFPSYDLISI